MDPAGYNQSSDNRARRFPFTPGKGLGFDFPKASHAQLVILICRETGVQAPRATT
ncbi:MAG: hypothetical protein H0A75_02995 [Candidatus Methanofishera endochildressiae]|uniref:Uncharacterized protein n=1 Tax=Candidatus Methanofishera endochildressiae TaxID=2738884 RepID=A0A7Z0MNC9_9GAMM|nr:hypothetical protein [Candidatus Methanofishera endochildressiae]